MKPVLPSLTNRCSEIDAERGGFRCRRISDRAVDLSIAKETELSSADDGIMDQAFLSTPSYWSHYQTAQQPCFSGDILDSDNVDHLLDSPPPVIGDIADNSPVPMMIYASAGFSDDSIEWLRNTDVQSVATLDLKWIESAKNRLLYTLRKYLSEAIEREGNDRGIFHFPLSPKEAKG